MPNRGFYDENDNIYGISQACALLVEEQKESKRYRSIKKEFEFES